MPSLPSYEKNDCKQGADRMDEERILESCSDLLERSWRPSLGNIPTRIDARGNARRKG
jgi:hypothetical protein